MFPVSGDCRKEENLCSSLKDPLQYHFYYKTKRLLGSRRIEGKLKFFSHFLFKEWVLLEWLKVNWVRECHRKPRDSLKVLFVFNSSTSQTISKNSFQHYSRVIMTLGSHSVYWDVVEPHFLDFNPWSVGRANRNSRDSNTCLWSIQKLLDSKCPTR